MVASTRIFAIVSRPLEVLHVPSGEWKAGAQSGEKRVNTDFISVHKKKCAADDSAANLDVNGSILFWSI
jgi:hypothetical protein